MERSVPNTAMPFGEGAFSYLRMVKNQVRSFGRSATIFFTLFAAFMLCATHAKAQVSVYSAMGMNQGTTSATFSFSFSGSPTGLSAGNFTVSSTGSVRNPTIVFVNSSGNTTYVNVNYNGSGGNITVTLANSNGVTPAITGLPSSASVTIPAASPPTCSIGSPSVSSTSSGPVTFPISYSFPNFDPGYVSFNQVYVAVNKTGTVNYLSVTASGGGDNYTVSVNGLSGNGTFTITIRPGAATDDVTNLPDNGAGPSSTVTVATPTISETGTLTPFSTYQGTASSPAGAFSISGAGMSAGITVTPPSGYEVGTDGVTFSSSALIGSSGTIASTLVYVRLKAADAAGTYSGNVQLTSTGALPVNIGVSGTVLPVAPTTQASNIMFSNTSQTGTTINWTPGNGSSEAVFISQGNSGYPSPANNFAYNANPVFGFGAQAGAGWYCVFNGSGSSVNVTGLAANTPYNVMVVDYNGAAPNEQYLTTAGIANPANVTTLQANTTVQSITAASTTPTNSTTLNYTVTFAAALNNTPSTGDFALSSTGTATGTINAVTGSGATYYVNVTNISGDGPLTLSMTNASDVTPGVSSLPFTGGYYTIDNTPPTVSIGAPSQSSIGNNGAGQVTYMVTYADANFKTSSLTTSDITLNAIGTATGTIGISGSGTTYTVTISNITGLGTLGISVAAGYSSDLAGNTDAGAGPSGLFNVVSSDATLSNLTLSSGTLSPAFSSGTTSGYTASVPYGAGSITVTPTTNNANAMATVDGFAASTPVNLNIGPNTITVQVTAQDGVTQQTYTITVTQLQDITTVQSITAATATPTNATTLDYTVIFAAALNNTPSTGDFALSSTGTATGTINSVTGSGTVYDVNVTGVSGDGPLTLSMTSGSDVTPTVSNLTYTGSSYTIDNTPPTLSISPPSVTSVQPGGSATVSYSVLYSDVNFNSYTLTPSNITLNTTNTADGSVTVTPLNSTSATVTISNITGSGTLGITIAPGTSTDLAGNTDDGAGPSATFAVVQPPSITSVSPSSGPVGTLVTITGSALTSPTAFTIGGQPAIVVSNNGSTLVAMVMPNAVTGSITLATAAGTATGSGNFTVTKALPPTAQQGGKLTESGGGYGQLGASVAISADGNTAVVGAPNDNGQNGDAIVYTRSVGTWTQGATLSGTGGLGGGFFGGINQGNSVAINANGNTIVVGGSGDNNGEGAFWVFTGSGNAWNQQGLKLVASNTDGGTYDAQGTSVAISADGNTLVEGGPGANSGGGAIWVFTRSAGTWSQATELSGPDGTSSANQGQSVAISADAATILEGGYNDNNGIGAAWVFTGSGSTWTQQQAKLIPSDANDGGGGVEFGNAAGLSADGNTAIMGGRQDNSIKGAVWIFTRSAGTWTQQGAKLFGTGAVGQATQGWSVAISADGNTAIDGALQDNDSKGAIWLFTRSNGTWTQLGSKLIGSGGSSNSSQGTSVSLSADGTTLLEGGSVDNGGVGSAWVFTGSQAPTTQAANVTFTNTASTTTTVGWTAGNGSSSAVFMAQGSSGSPAPANNTTYTANPAFSSGSQIGTSGWYCVYNGTGTSVNITGLTANTAYNLMVVTYSGTSGAEQYLTTAGTGNPATVTTLQSNTTVQSITAASSNPTNATTLDYTVTFAAALNNTPSTGDFALSSAGNAAGTINSVTGSGTTFDVNVTNVSGSGPLTLSMTGASDVTPNISNLPFTGGSYTINNYSTLSNFSFSVGTHPPAFVPGQTSYADTLNTSITSVAITPYTTSANATVTVNGIAVTPGSASQPIALYEGQTSTATIVVTAGDNSSQTTYTVAILRLPSGNAHLSYLSISNNTALSPAFATTTTSYTASVANTTTSVTLTPTVADANATVTVNGSGVTSGRPSQNIMLTEGNNTITAVVTAQNGTVLTYTIGVNRALSAVTTLSGVTLSTGTLSPAFASSTTSYTATVASTVTSITETPATTDPTATVTVNGTAVTSGSSSGAIALGIGNNTITTVVTAQNGTATETYTVIVTRAPATNAKLSYLGLSQVVLSPAFAIATTSYTASVANAVTSTNVEPIEVGPGATIAVNGVAVASGATTAVALGVGNNTINTVVTAQDGVTQVTYTVTVTRAPSTIATLSNLTLNNGTLSPAFASSTTSYTETVGNLITSITETPVVTDPTATITVNGTAVTSGSPSAAIALSAGANTITTVVTAQDGMTTDTYTVTVTRAPATNAKLSYLGLSQVVLSPAFAAATTSYTASVANTITSTNVEPIEVGPGATIAVNGVAVASGATTPVALIVGTNTINTVVTAQDGVTTLTYTVAVTRAPSAITTLANLTLNNGTLSPAFASSTTSYTATVSNTTTSITETPVVTDPTATVTVNGTAVTSGSPSATIALGIGNNTITTVVTAQNGTATETYTVTVTRAPATNAKLSYLGLSQVVLSPAFSNATTSYTASVANTITSTNVEPIEVGPGATIAVNGVAVASGATTAVALIVGTNTISTVVTAQDGVTTLTYTVVVTRSPSAIATLSNLTLNNGTLSPAFASSTTNYTETVGNLITSITETPVVTDPTATITVNGTAVTSGNPSAAIALGAGNNTITTVVTAQDGMTTDTYTVTVTRAPATNAKLSFLGLSQVVLSPSFAAATTSYTASVANTVTSTNVEPIEVGPGATITVNGIAVASGATTPVALNAGANTINTVVTAQDGVTQITYTVTVTRAPATNAKLSFLGLSQVVLSPAFATATTSYTASVANTITSTNVEPIEVGPGATIAVNGVAVASGATTPVALSVGANTINTVVTAQDGVTQVTYTVTVTRAPSAIATLSNLTLNNGTISPAFAGSTTSYTTTVANTITSITETPTVTDPTATITVNGVPVTSGTATNPIALNPGANTITTVVTAQDGMTTDTYTVTVTRQASSNAKLSYLGLSHVVLSPSFSNGTTSYTASVANTISSSNLEPIEVGPGATIAVNGVAVASGATTPVTLNVGTNVINTVVTAQDGVTQITYTVTVTRAAPSDAYVVYNPISVEKPTDSPQLTDDGIVVHQGVSPNGDGIDDYLQIDGITQYPDNKLTIINRSGMLIYEAKGYDNSSRTFDGHSNQTGQMQLPGTYFFALDYTVNGVIKHKTGYIILKY